MVSWRRPGDGQPWPRGIAAKVPRWATGTTGTPCSWARKAAPIRKLPIQPSLDRVPSGKITRLQPSASTSPGVVAIEPPRRSIGKVLKNSEEPTARHQVSKK